MAASPQVFADCPDLSFICGGSEVFEADTAGAGNGEVTFIQNSTLNASVADAISGGRQGFEGNSTLNASAANAISGGQQYFSENSTLNASVGNAVSGGILHFDGNSVLNVQATNAIAGANIQFFSGGTIRLNGYSTTLGRLYGPGLVTNDGATDGVLSVDASSGPVSAFSGVLQDGSGDGKLGLTLTAGNLTLSGANTYTGGTIVDGGTLKAGAVGAFVDNTAYTVNGGTLDLNGFGLTVSSLSGTGGAVALGAADLTVDQSANSSYDGVISGSGKVIKSGAGTLTLGGANVYTGGTTVAGGTLKAGAAGAFSDNTAYTVNGGTLDLNGFGLTVSSLSGTGGAVALGAADLTVDQAADTRYDGVISGSGKVIKSGSGTLILTGTNAYTGRTIIDAGILQLGDGGTSGLLVSNVVNNGTLIFNRSNNFIFSGGISGSGGLIQNGTGTTTLTSVNTYTGTTTVNSGTLKAAASSAFAGNTAYVVNGGTLDLDSFGLTMSSLSGTGGTIRSSLSATLTINQSTSTTYAGAFSGYGDLALTGTGTLTLTGNSSGFNRGATVGGGSTLIVGTAVGGAYGGAVTVDAGGRLGGSGRVGSALISGTVAPGNSIGTLNVGNIGFNTGSVYEVEANAAGQADHINATGAATITGGTVSVLAGAGHYAPATNYTILTAAGGVSGTFTDVTSNLAFLDPSLSYDADHVYLHLTRNSASFQEVAGTRNQVAVGTATNKLGAGNTLYEAILGLSADQARAAFDQLSGEIDASAKSALIADSHFVRDAANDRLRAAFALPGTFRAQAMAYGTGLSAGDAPPEQVATDYAGPVFWSQVYGSWGSTRGDGNAARLNRSGGGLLFGMDNLIGDWRLGLLAGYGYSSFKADDRDASGSANNYHLGVFGGTTWGHLALRSSATYTWHEIETTRSVSVPGLDERLKGDYDAGSIQAFGELGYDLEFQDLRLEPFANLAHVRLRSGAYAEHGGTAALAASASTTDTTFSTLGLRGQHDLTLGALEATLTDTLGWRRAFGDVTPTASQRFPAGDTFTIAGVPIAKNSAIVAAGLDFKLSPLATFAVSYTGQLASDARDHGVKANLAIRF